MASSSRRGSIMNSTTRVAVRGARFWLAIAVAAALATFALGLAAGAGLSRAGAVTGGAGRIAPASALDASRPYPTVQHGVVVPGPARVSGATQAPGLDTSRPYLTV